MTLDEIRETLLEAVSTKKIGSPVSLRFNLQLTQTNEKLSAIAATIVSMCQPLFELPPSRIFARATNNDRQLSLIGETESGRTCSITVGVGSAKSASLHLLLVGNHGVVRLEGAEMFDESSLTLAEDIDPIINAIEQSVETSALISP